MLVAQQAQGLGLVWVCLMMQDPDPRASSCSQPGRKVSCPWLSMSRREVASGSPVGRRQGLSSWDLLSVAGSVGPSWSPRDEGLPVGLLQAGSGSSVRDALTQLIFLGPRMWTPAFGVTQDWGVRQPRVFLLLEARVRPAPPICPCRCPGRLPFCPGPSDPHLPIRLCHRGP